MIISVIRSGLGIVAFAMISCANVPTPLYVDISQVYAQPEIFDGANVVLSGVVIFDRYDGAIYDHVTESCGPAHGAKAIQIGDEDMSRLLHDLHGRNFARVKLSGIFKNRLDLASYERRDEVLKDGSIIVTTLEASGPGPLTKVQVLEYMGYVEGCE